jgi:hypothetical protein
VSVELMALKESRVTEVCKALKALKVTLAQSDPLEPQG